MLDATWSASAFVAADIGADIDALMRVNERLWVIEDDIRDKERAQSFDAEFIRLARAVYVENDERAAIKRRINVKLDRPSSRRSPIGPMPGRTAGSNDREPRVGGSSIVPGAVNSV